MAVRHAQDPASQSGVYGPGRSTAQRRAVTSAVARFAGAFTADDLVARLGHEAPGVSTATIYRSIAAMAATGHLSHVGERDGAALYARCDETEHHHHLVCTSCGATAHTPCPVDPHALAATAPAGFVVTSHDVRLYGLCAACNAEAEPADGCACDGPVPSGDGG